MQPPWLVPRYDSIFCLLVFFSLALAENSFSKEIKWQMVGDREGIKTSRQTNNQGPLPAFKGVTEFVATRFDVLALMQDIPKNKIWMHECKESKKIQQTAKWSAVIYNRTNAPWPVSDRDVVIQTDVQLKNQQKKIFIKIQSIEIADAPKVNGIVRMPTLKGHYILTDIDTNKVRVEFLIEADPGGWLPHWIIRMASKKIPFYTLKNLREQVLLHKQKNTYADFISQFKGLRSP